jgi:REP element-mobilizing transposase RayT
MKRDYIDFQDRSTALAYLITFRCYGTWLHGDERGSVGRNGSNVFGQPMIKPSSTLRQMDAEYIEHGAFKLGPAERRIVGCAIREVSDVRGYFLFALNIRTIHVHLVTSNGGKVERMMDSFKAYSTRALRAAKLVGNDVKPWSRHGSTRYLWTERHIEQAVEYVVNGQGGELPSFE